MAHSSIYPGRVVDITIELGGAESGVLKAHVYPLGLRHMKRFQKQITKALGLAAGIKVGAGVSEKEVGAMVMKALVPHVMEDMIEMLQECVRLESAHDKLKAVKLDDLAHWDLPPIAEAWIMESFGESKKLKPWATMIETVVQQTTGKKIDLVQMMKSKPKKKSNEGSQPSSPPATVAAT